MTQVANTPEPVKNASAATEADRLSEIAHQVLRKAASLGASQAEIGASSEVGLSVNVRLGEVETVEYSRDRGVGVTVYFGTRKGSASTADLDASSIDSALEAACAIARFTQEDKSAGLADEEMLANEIRDLDLYHPGHWTADDGIDRAIAMEAAGLDSDQRITNSDGAALHRADVVSIYANSHGFHGRRIGTRHTASCSLMAEQGEEKQRDYSYDTRRSASDLRRLEEIGLEAGQRAVARLNARSVPTTQVPVMFTPELARSLFGHLVAAVSGGSLYRKASFLLDAAGEVLFPEFVQIDEMPFEPRGLRSTCFDSEGVATRERALVRDGELTGYVLSSYSARRLGLTSTGNAGGVHNLTIQPGEKSQSQLISEMDTGFVATELIGQGVNIVTGDYSRGAAGFWVEKGEISHPVQGVTIAGNLRDMYRNIAALGSDVDYRGGIRAPSVLISQMTVAGQ